MNTYQKITIYGERISHPDGSETFTLSGSNRAGAEQHQLDISQNEKLFQFELEDSTKWVFDNSTLHELFPGTDQVIKRHDKRGYGSEPFVLPAFIDSEQGDRSPAGRIALKVLNVISKKSVNGKVGQIAKKLENKNLLHGISPSTNWNAVAQKKYLETGAGIFHIGKDFSLRKFKSVLSTKPYFLFIHGTNSNSKTAFEDLQKSSVWESLHSTYGDQILTFQHRTLTESPLENTVKLASMLPHNAKVHILSHSRGGIIGDILALYSTPDEGKRSGFSEINIELLEKEGRANDVAAIQSLNKIFEKKNITVEKYIRVACPAAGTKLASKRLDNILNTFFNLFGGIKNPFFEIFGELVNSVVATKSDVNILPGLEAQNPDSPFIKVLNDRTEERLIQFKSLAVISGNGKLSVRFKGLKIILAKLFYQQRNDLVVNTDSMYLGVKTKEHIQYFFLEGPDVSHVEYFSNPTAQKAIEYAVITEAGQPIPGYKLSKQDKIPVSDRGIAGLDYGDLAPDPDLPTGNRPIAVLMPGIMGSNLKIKNNKLWIDYLGMLSGGLKKLQNITDKNIIAHSVVRTSYNRLYKRLSNTYDVVIYPFDWRQQLNDCAKEFNEKIVELLEFKQPIKLICHSMGGVVVRDFIVNHDATWQRLNRSKDFRLIFLGSPLGGSHRIVNVLFGQDSIIRKLDMIDRKHTKKELINMFTALPGILSLLPLSLDQENDFADENTWKKMRVGISDTAWPLPGKKDLDVFKGYRNKILSKKDTIEYSNMIYIAGKDDSTPVGHEYTQQNELVFLSTSEGDQSVTWESGIPKQLIDNDSVYFVNVTHGSLANAPEIFDGIEELLEKGETGLLRKTKLPQGRGAESTSDEQGGENIFRSPDDYDFDTSEQGVVNTIIGMATVSQPEPTKIPLNITVSNGDLKYSKYPIMVGHFIDDGILSAERVIDDFLNGRLSAKHEVGYYPGEIGTTDYFPGLKDEKFRGTIIVGLGEPGKLTAFLVTKAIEQGISNYLLSLSVDEQNTKFGISSLLIGCGYGGLSIESSVKAIIEGTNAANEKLANLTVPVQRAINHIEFIEIYQDKALNCFYHLKHIEKEENQNFNILVSEKTTNILPGLKKRIPFDSSKDWWTRITVKNVPDSYKKSSSASRLQFTIAGTSAREEESDLYLSTPLIDLYIQEVSEQNTWSPKIAKTLFELMVPNGLKDKLKQRENITWVLDEYAAGYPWELLQSSLIKSNPLCVNAGMIRQLITRDFRMNVKNVAENKALIIADPKLKGYVNQLPGARKEGDHVAEFIEKQKYKVESHINTEAADVMSSLFSDEYKILHLAGHGLYNPENPRESGMVIGNGIFLTVFEINQMTAVPELVFVNCCYLGNVQAKNEKYFQDRYKLAANIGTQLIQIGVKAVVAAGWPVNDDAAFDFANKFYDHLFKGDNFGDAVKAARTEIYRKYPEDNTWGAYQCYGDAFYTLKVEKQRQSSPLTFLFAEEALIKLENLLNKLQTGKWNYDDARKELGHIVDAIKKAEIKHTQLLEFEALIYLEMGDYQEAVTILDQLLHEEKAQFSFSTFEQYCNARAKLYTSKFIEASQNKKDTVEVPKLMNEVIEDLENLCKRYPTAERFNFLASAYKRKAMMIDGAERNKAYTQSIYNYKKAAAHKNCTDLVYPTINVIELEFILHISGSPWGSQFKNPSVKGYTLKEAQDTLRNLLGSLKNAFKDLDYWNMVSMTNINVCQLLLGEPSKSGGNSWGKITNQFKEIWKHAGSERKQKTALEHLQFLIYGISTAKNGKDKGAFKKRPAEISNEDFLQIQLKELEETYKFLGSKKRSTSVKRAKVKT